MGSILPTKKARRTNMDWSGCVSSSYWRSFCAEPHNVVQKSNKLWRQLLMIRHIITFNRFIPLQGKERFRRNTHYHKLGKLTLHFEWYDLSRTNPDMWLSLFRRLSRFWQRRTCPNACHGFDIVGVVWNMHLMQNLLTFSKKGTSEMKEEEQWVLCCRAELSASARWTQMHDYKNWDHSHSKVQQTVRVGTLVMIL